LKDPSNFADGRFEARLGVGTPVSKAVLRGYLDRDGNPHWEVGFNHKVLPLTSAVIRLKDGREVKVGVDVGAGPVTISFRMSVTKLLAFLYLASTY
jgi:hypothetical protein